MKNVKKTNIRATNGVTLVALTVTIIVLVILATVSIVSFTNKNTVVEQAKQAKQEAINAQEKENTVLQDYANKISTYTMKEEKEETIRKEVFTKEDFTINTAYIDAVASNITVATYGKVVTITFALKVNTNLANGSYVLVSGFPQIDGNCSFLGRANNASKVCMNLNIDGELALYWNGTTIQKGDSLQGYITYIEK